ncbi:MAG: hypothetical protein HY901_32835, partial [Deltaproteobacteria bacterium]|nr:hypothetical protein [Deltaproteobacteria bacterium]
EGDECNVLALDQCKEGLACLTSCFGGAGGGGLAVSTCYSQCVRPVPAGGLCTTTEQCPSGLTCRAPVFGAPKQCLRRSHSTEVGEACTLASECRTELCVFGRCRCRPDDCPGYCGTLDALCHPAKETGGSCCGDYECLDRCSINLCIEGTGTTVPSPGVCFSPRSKATGESCVTTEECSVGACLLGTCRCRFNGDCGSGERCNLDPLGGTVGVCQGRKSSGSLCAPLLPDDCADGLRCGGLPARCYRPGSAGFQSACQTNEHCSSGRCEPSCADWTSGCSLACSCDSHSNCASDRYCASTNVPGGSVSACLPRFYSGTPCSYGEQCRSGTCSCTPSGCFYGICSGKACACN